MQQAETHTGTGTMGRCLSGLIFDQGDTKLHRKGKSNVEPLTASGQGDSL